MHNAKEYIICERMAIHNQNTVKPAPNSHLNDQVTCIKSQFLRPVIELVI